MRRLMWFTIGFAVSCGLFAYLLSSESCGRVALICLVLCAGAGFIGRNLRLLSLVLLGCSLGSLWYGWFSCVYLSAPAALSGKTEFVTLRITDYPQERESGVVTEGQLFLDGRNYRVMLWLDTPNAAQPGCVVTGPFRFSMTAPDADPVSWYSGNGVFLLGFQQDTLTVKMDEKILWADRVAEMRKWLREALRSCFPTDTEPFARALLLADTSALDYETDTALKVSGIRHVVAVSGLHVSILIALLGTMTFRKRFLTVPVGLCVLLLFAALAGFTPSVVRACVMSGLLLLAMLLNREYDGPTALAFAVLVMVLANPLVIASVSFQLSVASMAGIYLLEGRLRSWFQGLLPDPGRNKRKQKWIGRFCASVSVSISALALTAPLCAYYFGMVSLVGVLTNLLVLWTVSGIFYGIMAVCLMYAVWLPGAQGLAWLVSWAVRYVLAVARWMACVPFGAVYMDTVYNRMWLVFVYILLAVFCFGRRNNVRQLVCCGVLSLCAAMFASWGCAGTHLTVLDVGQGQCILVRAEGRTYMVDCGGDSATAAADKAANYLLSRGIRRLDGLILTHLDADHAGGAEYLLSRMEVDLLIVPPVYTELRGTNTVCAVEDLCIRTENTEIRIYTPTFPGTGNEMSLCVLFDTENCDILITGDRDAFGERMLLKRADIPDVDILIAGHHGSKYSTCEELLIAAAPEIVCISAGLNNSYGHPAGETLQRLADFGCIVYRTDYHGTVTIRR